MLKFEELYQRFCEYLEKEKFNYEPIELYEPISYTLSLGGKRIRPIMALLSCDFFGGDIKDAMNPAMGIEIFHNFTLLHDDIMDDAPIRRGRETVYKRWNSNIAILSGDTMFALAYKYITQTGSKYLKTILEVFNKTAIEVCEGQQYDMNYETEENISIDDYMNMIRLKTAVFLGAALRIGALIAEASEENVEQIYAFGENLGMAFQLQDDYLDVFGDEEKFGKKTGGDIITNKKTFLYLKAFELANEKELEILKEHFIPNHPNNDLKVERIKDIYLQLKVDEYSAVEINRYYFEAMEHFKKIDCPKCNKEEMLSFAKRLIKREY